MNKKEVLKQINSNPDLASKARAAIYRDKTFAIVDSRGVEAFKKTKKGAEGYIKKQQNISYYDDYTQSMVSCGDGLKIIEINFTEINDPKKDMKIWYEYIKKLYRHGWILDDVIYLAKRLEASQEIKTMVNDMIKEIKETKGYTVREELETIEEQTENITEAPITDQQEKAEETNNNITDQEKESQEIETNITATYTINEEKNGVEIYFTEKPSEETRNILKSHGFRWSKYKKCWYAKQSDETIQLAEQITNSQQDETSSETFEYPEIEIDDIHEYTIDKDLQKREHEANWIFRTKEKDHTKEIQNIFLHYTNKVKKIINEIDNPYYEYKIKQSLQSFKKKYHELYVKWLSQKANCPSWVVTGRGNLNVRSYNKKQERANNTMLELAALPEEFEKKVKHYKYKALKEKEQAIRQKALNTDINIQFKTETKEFEYMGIKERKRVYTHENYWIVKTWGCYRIFKDNKEIHSMKSYDKLEEAKKYACYLIQKDQQAKTA